MSFWALIQRELRLAARRKSTFRLRVWSVIVGIVACFFSLLLSWVSVGRGGLGHSLFNSLSGYCFFLCLLAGVFLTSDCLSLEKREGTLDLLLLTDMTGYELVIGKLCGVWVNAFYTLLALLPITALPLLLGGVTGNEFWRMTLALENALFFSLASGLFVSAFGREVEPVMGLTAGFLLLAAVGLPMLARFSSLSGLPRSFSYLAWISPFYSYFNSSESRYLSEPKAFWIPLLASGSFGWVLLFVAGWALPSGRQESGFPLSIYTKIKHRFGFASRPVLGAVQRKPGLLAINPVLWLIGEHRGARRILWATVAIWAVTVFVASFSPASGTAMVFQSGYAVRPFGFVLKALCAVLASHFFVTARRNGKLEVLLTTPLTLQDVVQGQTLALKRLFVPPVLTFFGLAFFPALLHLALIWKFPDFPQMLNGGFALLVHGVYCVRSVADFWAVALVSIWLSIAMRKPNLAPGLSVLFVLVLPSVLCWLDFFADLGFIAWASGNLRSDLRRVLARQFSTPAAA